MLAYLARYSHRVAIANRRLIACNARGVTFRWKDYRLHGAERNKTMALGTDEFIRRFLLHVLPEGFHRIRHCGLFANPARVQNLKRARELIARVRPEPARTEAPADALADLPNTPYRCRCCGAAMVIIETFARGQQPRAPPLPGAP